MFVCAEYFALGPFSMLVYSNEGAGIVQWLMDQAHTSSEPLFAWSWVGGIDVAGSSDFVGEHVSLERTLLASFPFWIAQALHKISVVGIAFIGMYVLARRATNADRLAAVSVAALFSIYELTHHHVTWMHGVGYAVIPAAIFVCVCRIGCSKYWLGVLCIACLVAVSGSLVHSIVALMAALVISGVLLRPNRFGIVLAATVIIGAVVSLNWAEVLYGLASLAPMSSRGAIVASPDPFQSLVMFFLSGHRLLMAGMFVSSIVTLMIMDRVWALRSFAALALVFCAYFVWAYAPWGSVGLEFFEALNYAYVLRTLPVFAALAAAATLACLSDTKRRKLSLLVAAFAVGVLIWTKAYHGALWFVEGGSAEISTIVLPSADTDGWKMGGRVVSMPYLLPPSLSSLRGFSAMDGVVNIISSRVDAFWRAATRSDGLSMDPFFALRPSVDPRTVDALSIGESARLDLLKVAGVQHVFSRVPLDDVGQQVVGPTGPNPFRQTDTSITGKLASYWSLRTNPPGVRAYSLTGAYDMVFTPSKMSVADQPLFWDVVATQPRHGVTLMINQPLETVAALRTALAGNPTVAKWMWHGDALHAALEAPDGGVIVFNVRHDLFMRGFADGQPVPLVPVNGIHSAMIVPPGTITATLCYVRLKLRDRLWSDQDTVNAARCAIPGGNPGI